MPIHIRPRNNGRSFELRITHKLLPKPYYRNFDTRDEAQAFGDGAERFLVQNVIPVYLLPAPRLEFTDIASAIRLYEKENGVPHSTAAVLATVSADVGSTKLTDIDYLWAQAWVKVQKLTHLRAPGTIRHHVGGLARCLDWVTNAYPTYLAQNPLHKLPRGYASCNRTEAALLRAKGLDLKEDVERDRRISTHEEIAIVAVFKRRAAEETDPLKKAWHEGALLMFQLALETAMRMRELYTLEIAQKQIDLGLRTVFVNRTKNGDRRQVPLSSVALALLEGPLSQQPQAHRQRSMYSRDVGTLYRSSGGEYPTAGVFQSKQALAVLVHIVRIGVGCRPGKCFAERGNPHNQSTQGEAMHELLQGRMLFIAIVVGGLVASTASAQTSIQVNTAGSGSATYDPFTASAGPFPFSNFGVGASASLGGTAVNVGISGSTMYSFPSFTSGQVLLPYITNVNVGYAPTWNGSVTSNSSFSANVNFQYDIGPFSGSDNIFNQNLNTAASGSFASGSSLAAGMASDTASGSVFGFKLGEDALFASASVGINVGANYTNSVQYAPTAQYGITSWVSTVKNGGPTGSTQFNSVDSGSLNSMIFNPGGIGTGTQVYINFEPSVLFDMPVTPYSVLSAPVTGNLHAEAFGDTLVDYNFPIANLFDLPVNYDPWDVNALWNSGLAFSIPAMYEHNQIGDVCDDPANNCNVFVVDGLTFSFAPLGFTDSGPNSLIGGLASGSWDPRSNTGGPLPPVCDPSTGICYASTDPQMPIGSFTTTHSVTQVNPNGVPEPASLPLLGIGLVAMLFVPGRQRARSRDTVV